MAQFNKKNVKRKSRDHQNKPSDSTPSQTLPIQFDDDVPDFPRGGGSKLSREERDEIRAQVDEEFDSHVRDSKRRKKKKTQGSRKSNDDDLGSLFGEGISVKLPNKITLKVESRAAVPPLEVILDDIEDDKVFVKPNKEETANVPNPIDEKSKRRAKKKANEEEEQQIRVAEQRLLNKDIPRTSDEFEKVVRTSPNSSFVWIKYMEFMISMADVEGARSVADRALSTINITNETEKLNVWVAYLNFENQYGNPPEEAVARLFQRALQFCDPLKLHLELLKLYERTEQHKLADELLKKMVKKFKQLSEVWLMGIQWYLKTRPEEVDKLMNRAILSLPKHEHIQFFSQVAINEFKSGVDDKARSIFEKMLREHPKRLDLWSVYLDQEIRLGDVDLTRALFERAISLSHPPKKMKFLFKKFLKYEESHGDASRVQYVKQKAREYVETAAI